VVADYRRLGWDGGCGRVVVALVEPLVPLVAGMAMRSDAVVPVLGQPVGVGDVIEFDLAGGDVASAAVHEAVAGEFGEAVVGRRFGCSRGGGERFGCGDAGGGDEFVGAAVLVADDGP